MPIPDERLHLPAVAAASLTGPALSHLRAMARAVAPGAPALQERFLADMAAQGYDPARRRALAAITPASAALLLSGRRAVSQFLELVEYSGRRLAKLNVPPSEAARALHRSDRLLAREVEDRFAPAREHLQLATILTLNHAYFEVREGETQAFYGLAHAEAESRDLTELLHRFARVLARAVHARAASLSLLDRLPAARRQARFLSGRARPLDARIAQPGGSYWSFPIRSGDEISGVIELAFPRRYPWLPRELELLSTAAERCGRAIERARLLEQIARLSAAARRAEEEERRRLGRELHDETAQSLLVLRLQMEMLEREAPSEMRLKLQGLRESLEDNIGELRRVIAALSPALLERLGLAPAIRQLAERFRKRYPVELRTRVLDQALPVSEQVAEAVYRIAQEALQNVLRHSQATHVNLLLRIADRLVKLSVVDNGVGFDADGVAGRPMSFGLLGMRERASLVGGALQIRSAPGKGTAVVLEVPRSSAETVTHGKDTSSSHR